MDRYEKSLRARVRQAAHALDSRNVDDLVEAKEAIERIIDRSRDPLTGDLLPPLRHLADDALTLLRLAEEKLHKLTEAAAEERVALGRLLRRCAKATAAPQAEGGILVPASVSCACASRTPRRQRRAASAATSGSSDDDPPAARRAARPRKGGAR